jgi:hypothetical protein
MSQQPRHIDRELLALLALAAFFAAITLLAGPVVAPPDDWEAPPFEVESEE